MYHSYFKDLHYFAKIIVDELVHEITRTCKLEAEKGTWHSEKDCLVKFVKKYDEEWNAVQASNLAKKILEIANIKNIDSFLYSLSDVEFYMLIERVRTILIDKLRNIIISKII
jgi:hypothetical protein